MRLYLVRHGQTSWNALNRAQGHSDIPLDEVGKLQAGRLAERMKSVRATRIISSDLMRCVQTAEPVAQALDLPLELDVRIRERSMGEFEGKDFESFKSFMRQNQTPDDPFAIQVQPPGGESMAQVFARIRPVAEEMLSHDSDVIIITHGGTAGMVLAGLLRGDPLTSRAFRFKNAAVTELFRNELGLFVMDKYNCDAHLEGLQVLAGSLDGTTR